MRKNITRGVVLGTVALMALAACSSRSDSSSTSTSGAAAKGFGANALIGVALPAKTSVNWALAGSLFTADLKAAGFQSDVQYAAASGTVADQQGEISTMVTKGAKVIIIGAQDGGQLSTQVEAAQAAGIKVIAYDRLILNTKAVDYYVAYDNYKVGVLQGQALLDGMKAKKAKGPYTIEVFAGSPDDANAQVFFDGAMSVLKPEIASGNVVVGSGQKDFKQVTTDGWKPENAQRRMDTLMTSTYSGKKTLDGVLSPNDTLARAILTSVAGAGKPTPIVTGQDSEPESVKSIMAGKQYSTINKDTRNLVKQAVTMVTDLSTGKVPTTNSNTYNNGVKVVPAFLLPPVIVTKANAAASYANDPTLEPLTK